jgi:hypothetical protein
MCRDSSDCTEWNTVGSRKSPLAAASAGMATNSVFVKAVSATIVR